ncbi:adenylyl-sulfate kinase [Magnetospirillum fulvum]|uniref:Adenylyl-sulfate kinase n=1 Tax=Magnetospirillum fulvum TaxID=1082 RepID=A0A1H6HJQ1_MAGFU|nr:adenylyl-sulfate kinase [Magnetospirillum fulvum]SEH34464.1 adenylylsulfate kinase /sulfate adenylyltransferase subunit 1 [Magnetospirillum fulvum]
MTSTTSPMNIVVVGHVDHGKSTLVGRLLHETGALPDGKVETLREVCDRRGMPFEWAFVMDALQAERDQGITIDTARIRFRTQARPYVIIDAPGHKEFLKNMITGAASAEAALLVIDAAEGVREQSRRHGYLLHLLGLRQVAVAVNKMDLVGFDQSRFDEVKAEIVAYLGSIGLSPTHVIPVAARSGANISAPATETPWYTGPTVLAALDGFTPAVPDTDLPLRFPIQDVYKFDHRRLIAGRIESGRLAVGDSLTFAPSGKTARVASLEHWGAGEVLDQAGAGRSVAITLDEQIFVERGQIASHADTPPTLSHSIAARLFWLGHNPLTVGARYRLKLATAEHTVEVSAIRRVIDVVDLGHHDGIEVGRNAVAEIELRTRTPVAHDAFADNPRLGRFVLVEGHDIVGGGVIARTEGERIGAVLNHGIHPVDLHARSLANGHRGGVLWLTGLSGAGKSTIAAEVERRLFLRGWQVTILDGDALRLGLNSDLGFSPEDRAENIRRSGEVAHLLAESGLIVLAAFISPYRADRDRVRSINPEAFHEIHVATSLDECERRDPKGLYGQARAGAIPHFTGLTAPYEPPETPELALVTEGRSVEESVSDLLHYIDATFALTAQEQAERWGL